MATQKFNLGALKISREEKKNEENERNNIENVPEIPENLKTMLQLSKDLGVDKQKIYRTVTKCNIPHQEINKIIYLDETAQTLIKSIIFPKNTVSKNYSETQKKTENDTILKQLEYVIQILQEELKSKTQQLNEKDKQIAELTKLVDQQQQLHLVEQKKVLQLEQKEPAERKRGFFWK